MAIELDPRAGPDGTDEGRRLALFWINQIDKVDTEQKRYLKRGRMIEKRYRDERNRAEEEGHRRSNSLWANTQIIYPAIYGKQPLPIAERRFRDKDPIGRAASQIIERALRNDMETDHFHESVGNAVLDYLLSGKGVAWVRYEPEIGEGISLPIDGENDLRDTQGDIEPHDDSEEEEKLEETGDRIIKESAPVDYVPWEDFYMFPAKARTWREVRAVGKRVYMSKDQMIEKWGEEIGDQIPLQKDDKSRREGRSSDEEIDDKAHVYEIWDLDHEEVVWVAEGYAHLINAVDDPLELEHFFPVPKPLLANATNNSMVPIPFFIQYQDQAKQIDELTQRMSQIIKACKVAGTYNAAADEIFRLLDESVENELIPVDDWATFADKKGVEGQISLLPLDNIINVIKELREEKDRVVAEMDRLTGITDILRGVTSDGRETLGGQKLKNNNSKSRIRQQQDEVARFCRDIVRIKSEILCKHFHERSLIDASGCLYEEGLGIADVMELMQGDASEPVQAPPQPHPAPQGMGAPMLPPPPQGAPGQPPGPPTGQQNVVPLRPQQPPMGPPQQPPQHNQYGQLSPPEKIIKALMKIKQAIALLRNDYKRGFRVDIEVDSTIVGDQQQDKEARIEFLKMTTEFMTNAGQIAQQQPAALPLLSKFLQFGVRGFPIGRDLEQSIEEFCDQAEQMAKEAMSQPKPPNPEMIKAQVAQQKGKVDIAKAQMQMQNDRQKAQAEVQRQAVENQGEQANAQADMQQKRMDMAMKRQEMEIELIRQQTERIKAEAALRQSHMQQQQPQPMRKPG